MAACKMLFVILALSAKFRCPKCVFIEPDPMYFKWAALFDNY